MDISSIDDKFKSTCIHCGKPIYWGPRDIPKGVRPNPDSSQFRHWRHVETQIEPCNWTLPIKWAQPTDKRTPPVGAEISDSLKAELKRVYPDEFPDY